MPLILRLNYGNQNEFNVWFTGHKAYIELNLLDENYFF